MVQIGIVAVALFRLPRVNQEWLRLRNLVTLSAHQPRDLHQGLLVGVDAASGGNNAQEFGFASEERVDPLSMSLDETADYCSQEGPASLIGLLVGDERRVPRATVLW